MRRVNLHLEDELHAALKRVCKKKKRTIQTQLVRLVKKFVHTHLSDEPEDVNLKVKGSKYAPAEFRLTGRTKH